MTPPQWPPSRGGSDFGTWLPGPSERDANSGDQVAGYGLEKWPSGPRLETTNRGRPSAPSAHPDPIEHPESVKALKEREW